MNVNFVFFNSRKNTSVFQVFFLWVNTKRLEKKYFCCFLMFGRNVFRVLHDELRPSIYAKMFQISEYWHYTNVSGWNISKMSYTYVFEVTKYETLDNCQSELLDCLIWSKLQILKILILLECLLLTSLLLYISSFLDLKSNIEKVTLVSTCPYDETHHF